MFIMFSFLDSAGPAQSRPGRSGGAAGNFGRTLQGHTVVIDPGHGGDPERLAWAGPLRPTMLAKLGS